MPWQQPTNTLTLVVHHYTAVYTAVCNVFIFLMISGPCVPQHAEVQYGLSIGQLSWDRSKGASMFTAKAVTDQGSVLSCSTSDTYCALYNLSCSQTYEITVAAHNNICHGAAVSASTFLETGALCFQLSQWFKCLWVCLHLVTSCIFTDWIAVWFRKMVPFTFDHTNASLLNEYDSDLQIPCYMQI